MFPGMYPAVGRNCSKRACVPGRVCVGGPLDVPKLDFSRGPVRQHGHRKAELQQLLLLVPVHVDFEVQCTPVGARAKSAAAASRRRRSGSRTRLSGSCVRSRLASDADRSGTAASRSQASHWFGVSRKSCEPVASSPGDHQFAASSRRAAREGHLLPKAGGEVAGGDSPAAVVFLDPSGGPGAAGPAAAPMAGYAPQRHRRRIEDQGSPLPRRAPAGSVSMIRSRCSAVSA